VRRRRRKGPRKAPCEIPTELLDGEAAPAGPGSIDDPCLEPTLPSDVGDRGLGCVVLGPQHVGDRREAPVLLLYVLLQLQKLQVEGLALALHRLDRGQIRLIAARAAQR